MKRNRIIGIIAAAALVIAFVIGVNLWKSRSVFRVEQDGKGTILVTARNTAEGAAGESSLSLGERRSLVVRSSLKGDGTLRLDAMLDLLEVRLIEVRRRHPRHDAGMAAEG